MAKHLVPSKIDSLEFRNIDFSYEEEQELLKQVNFSFPTDKIVWVKSATGSGRSTLLQLMAGLIEPKHGEYLINQVDAIGLSFEEFLPYRLSIGYSFDYGGLLSNRSLLENLTLPLVYHNILSASESEERASEYMHRMGMRRYLNHRPALVQGAVRKMGCLLRSLILHPQVLILDDPTVGLGKEVSDAFFQLVKELREQGFLRHLFISSFDERIMSELAQAQIQLVQQRLELSESMSKASGL